MFPWIIPFYLLKNLAKPVEKEFSFSCYGWSILSTREVGCLWPQSKWRTIQEASMAAGSWVKVFLIDLLVLIYIPGFESRE
jgi:hypothetical protein